MQRLIKNKNGGLYEFYHGWFKVDLLMIKKKGEMLYWTLKYEYVCYAAKLQTETDLSYRLSMLKNIKNNFDVVFISTFGMV